MSLTKKQRKRRKNPRRHPAVDARARRQLKWMVGAAFSATMTGSGWGSSGYVRRGI